MNIYIYWRFKMEMSLDRRITEEEERASQAIANLAGRSGIQNFHPLSPSGEDIRTLEHEGTVFKNSFPIKSIILKVILRFYHTIEVPELKSKGLNSFCTIVKVKINVEIVF